MFSSHIKKSSSRQLGLLQLLKEIIQDQAASNFLVCHAILASDFSPCGCKTAAPLQVWCLGPRENSGVGTRDMCKRCKPTESVPLHQELSWKPHFLCCLIGQNLIAQSASPWAHCYAKQHRHSVRKEEEETQDEIDNQQCLPHLQSLLQPM